MRDIYDIEKRLESILDRIKKSPKISRRNKEILFKFQNELIANGRSIHRVLFYMNRFWNICRWLSKDLDRATKDDLKELIPKIWRMDYAPRSKLDYNCTIKSFYKWLEGNNEEYPDKVKWIKTNESLCNKRLPEDLLTKEEVEALIKVALNIRDKALISILYESGCRVGELLTLKQKNVEFDEYGAIIRVHGKTGSRRVRLISSVPHLANWLENHPLKGNPDSLLWVSVGPRNNSGQIMYSAVVRLLERSAAKCNIKKRINPHSFRHARATHLASKLTEAQMKEYFGWTQGSDQASTYVHLSGRDVDNAILKIHGKLSVDEEKTNGEMNTKECARCKYVNSPESEFCGRCRLPLTLEKAIDAEKKEKEFLNMVTPEMIETLINKKVQEILETKYKNMQT